MNKSWVLKPHFQSRNATPLNATFGGAAYWNWWSLRQASDGTVELQFKVDRGGWEVNKRGTALQTASCISIIAIKQGIVDWTPYKAPGSRTCYWKRAWSCLWKKVNYKFPLILCYGAPCSLQFMELQTIHKHSKPNIWTIFEFITAIRTSFMIFWVTITSNLVSGLPMFRRINILLLQRSAMCFPSGIFFLVMTPCIVTSR